tara:strand:- start:6879 stop:7577 length:699 start_codon:yes stop_codon:yes gene_type:complete
MKSIQILFFTLLVTITGTHAFELSDITDRLFEDNLTGVEGQLKDAEFEFQVNSVLLLDDRLRKNSHILVARNRNSVLIAGQAKSEELKTQVQRVVLETANLKWTQGDVNQVEPSNAQVCGEKASKMAANERRRFNLKTVAECSTVNRFYNEVRLTEPMSELAQSDDDVLRATISNRLLRESIIDKVETIKVVVSDRHVYLLGDQLDQLTADRATALVRSMAGIKKVMPLFRF